MFHHILLQAATSPAVTSTVTAIADTAKNAAANASAQAQMSLIDLVKSGGPIMYPLGLLSLLAVYFFIERYLFIKRSSKMSVNFVDSLKDFIHNNNIDAARAFCKNTDTPQARIMLKGITKL